MVRVQGLETVKARVVVRVRERIHGENEETVKVRSRGLMVRVREAIMVAIVRVEMKKR
jgi:hypothetical protein